MKFTREKERTLLDENADPVDRGSAMFCMEVDGVRRHEALIISFLDHPNEVARGYALSLLFRWMPVDYFSMVLDWCRNDPDDGIRAQMLLSLLSFGLRFPARMDEIISFLVHRIENEPERYLQAMAYEYACRLLDQPREVDEDTFDNKRDVDWKLLGRYQRPTSKDSEPPS